MTLVIPEFLAETADRHPDRPAVIDGDRAVTYGELDARASQLAHHLTSIGVEPGDRVGVYGTKSADIVIALYGAMRAGAAYVPLDPKAPVARNALVLREAGVSVLLGTTSRSARWGRLVEGGAPLTDIVSLDGESTIDIDGVALHGPDAITAHPTARPAVTIAPDDLAYVLFTSGSTGSPKGVMLTHRNGASFARWAAEAVALTSDDRLSSHAPFHFDLSVFDLYGACWAGASVHLVPAGTAMFPVEVAAFIRDRAITVWYSVPTALRELADHGGLVHDDLASLRAIVYAGEVFPIPALARLMRLLPKPQYWNWFGPTETNVCTAYRVPAPPAPDDGDVPIGTPIDVVRVSVRTDDGSEAGPGEQGELLVAGPTVTAGYWGDPVRTQRALIPISDDADAPIAFRTGDVVERRRDGNLVFVGRRDHQIKSRGHRIELGEIEAVIHRHIAVAEAAVVAVPDDELTNRIHAYVVLDDSATVADVARHCRAVIPEYMVPSEIEAVAAIPRTSTGKIDRSTLAAGAGARPAE